MVKEETREFDLSSLLSEANYDNLSLSHDHVAK